MQQPRAAELERLIARSAQNAQVERRSLAFTVQLLIVNAAFALAVAAPGAEALFGHLSVARAWSLAALPLASIVVNSVFYRRTKPDNAVYRASESIEIALLYSNQLAFIFFGGLRWSPLWALCPFAAVFFAATQPFAQRGFAVLFTLSHGLFAAAALSEGRASDAAVALGFGATSFAAYAVLSSVMREAVFAEADLHLARAESASARLEGEKQRIALELGATVSVHVAQLVTAMQSLDDVHLAPAIEQAQSAQREMELIAAQTHASGLPKTVGELADVLSHRLRPFQGAARCEIERLGELQAPLETGAALALLRITQELVRNAITHGEAGALLVTLNGSGSAVSLAVRDDGSGLHQRHFERATGGLTNAKRWAEEQGGTFRLVDRDTGSELHVTLPIAM